MGVSVTGPYSIDRHGGMGSDRLWRDYFAREGIGLRSIPIALRSILVVHFEKW